METNPLPGLSVWLWGPTMWSILQAVAALSDKSQSRMLAEELEQFYRLTQMLLPCRYCKESYGPILEECIDASERSFKEIILERRLTMLIFCVHNSVNRKLAKQRWDDVRGVLKSILGESSYTKLDCEDTQNQVLSVFDKTPTLLSVYKRDVIFQNEPINLHATHILCIVFSRRSEADPSQAIAFRHFLNILSIYFANIPNASIQTWCKLLVDALRSITGQGSLTHQLERIYFNFYPCTPHSLEEKIKMFVSSGCGAGTCK
jgi:hypothetical protein